MCQTRNNRLMQVLLSYTKDDALKYYVEFTFNSSRIISTIISTAACQFVLLAVICLPLE